MAKTAGDVARHRRLLGPPASSVLGRLVAALPASDEHTVVLVGALCREPDLDAAVARMRAELPPEGRVVFLEHVGRPGIRGRLQALGGAPFARLPWGCHVDRDVPAAFRRNGFVVTDLERITMPTPAPVLRPWVRGVAVPRGDRS
jgi:hypothetical protein